MDRIKVSTLAVGVCLLFAVGVYGQRQRPAGERSRDAGSAVSAPVVSRPVEPDSPATDSTATANSQASSQAASQAIVPRLIKFSGLLRDVMGKPLSGPLDVTFALYDISAGGDPLWFETQTVQADQLGHYTALLGEMHSDGLPVELFTSGEVRWLGIQVGHEQEQQPRVLLVSVPYALKAGDAETLGGKPASAYMLSGSQSAGTSGSGAPSKAGTVQAGGSGKKRTKNGAGPLIVTPCSSMTGDGAALANQIAFYTSACALGEDAAFVDVGGNIGIGTAAPSSLLHISATSNDFFRLQNTGASGHIWEMNPLLTGVGNGGFEIRDVTAGSTRLAIDSSGNVGIGTASPQAPLQIGSGFGGYAGFKLVTWDSIAQKGLGIGHSSAANSIQGRSGTDGGNNSDLILNPYAGNVGIWTTSPQAPLQIGSGFGSYSGFKLITWDSTAQEGVAIGYSGAANSIQGRSGTDGGNNSHLILNPYGGNVGIGTTAPVARLDVAGNINIPPTSGAGAGVISIGGTPFLHAFGNNNTFLGANAGNFSMTGTFNTASGANALQSNTTGSNNTASGRSSLPSNTSGGNNTASGTFALDSNTTGSGNTASGYQALLFNTTGSDNTASGWSTLYSNSTGNNNIAIGKYAGQYATTGSNNIYIGNGGANAEGATIRMGSSGIQTKTFVAGISGVTTGGAAVPVMVDGFGQLGTVSSSRRFKYDIHDMGEASKDLLRLRPVTFRYKQAQNDGSHPLQYGLIAEEVAQVDPGLVQYSATGEANTVLYQLLPPMLLNEAQKQQRQIEAQARQVVAQERQIETEARQIAAQERKLQAQQEETKRASLQKDAQIRQLTQQVQELQKSRQSMAALEARLARLEAGNKSNQTVAAAHHTKKRRAGSLVAKVQF